MVVSMGDVLGKLSTGVDSAASLTPLLFYNMVSSTNSTATPSQTLHPMATLKYHPPQPSTTYDSTTTLEAARA
jgi:hypothetical protein